jgi:hypothetical protein
MDWEVDEEAGRLNSLPHQRGIQSSHRTPSDTIAVFLGYKICRRRPLCVPSSGHMLGGDPSAKFKHPNSRRAAAVAPHSVKLSERPVVVRRHGITW